MENTSCKVCGYDPEAEVRRRWEFNIEAVWPSQNQLSSNLRGRGGFKYRKWRRVFEDTIPFAAPQADGFRRLWLTRHWGIRKRAYDFANLVGGGKPLIDTLVSCGWLLDDSPTDMVAYYFQEKAVDRVDRITIVIEDICNTAKITR